MVVPPEGLGKVVVAPWRGFVVVVARTVVVVFSVVVVTTTVVEVDFGAEVAPDEVGRSVESDGAGDDVPGIEVDVFIVVVE